MAFRSRRRRALLAQRLRGSAAFERGALCSAGGAGAGSSVGIRGSSRVLRDAVSSYGFGLRDDLDGAITHQEHVVEGKWSCTVHSPDIHIPANLKLEGWGRRSASRIRRRDNAALGTLAFQGPTARTRHRRIWLSCRPWPRWRSSTGAWGRIFSRTLAESYF